MLTVMTVRPPDILVDDKGTLIAVTDTEGQLVITSTRNAFKNGIWLRRAGVGCIYRAGGQTVALILEHSTVEEDCSVASVVISRTPVRRRSCRRPLAVIDCFKLWREGPHELWLVPGNVRIESVARSSGDRPWNRRAGRYRD